MKTTEIQDISPEDQAIATILTDSAVKSAMKKAFDAIIIILSITTLITLLLPKNQKQNI